MDSLVLSLCIIIAILVYELRKSSQLRAEWQRNAELWEKKCRKYKEFIDNEATGWNERIKEAGLTDD